MEPTLKAPGTKRLKLKYIKLLSMLLQFCLKFAFIFNLRRYTTDAVKISLIVPVYAFTVTPGSPAKVGIDV